MKTFEINRIESHPSDKGYLGHNPFKEINISDTLAVEEPLEIRIEYGPDNQRLQKSISITMRTPGHDFELAAGFLFSEGILTSRSQIDDIQFVGPTKNIVKVCVDPTLILNLTKLERHFYTSSSCGICGKSSIESIATHNPKSICKIDPTAPLLRIKPHVINSLPDKLRKQQCIFDSTGGLHACGTFDDQGDILVLREDVGRHNALDKLIGHYFLQNKLPLNQLILLVSGRASFELVQKASIAGIKIFSAVGAPSSLAVELAKDAKMSLLGFVKNQRFNIYNDENRIILD